MSQPSVRSMVAVSVSALIVASLVAGCSSAPNDQGVATPTEQPTQPSSASEDPTRPFTAGSPEAGDDASFPKGAWAEYITYYLADEFDDLDDDSLGEYEGYAPGMEAFGIKLARVGEQAKGRLAEKLASDGPTSDAISGKIEALIAVSEQAKDVGVQVQEACTGADSRPSTECQIAWEQVSEAVDALFEEFEPWWSSDGARFISRAESAGQAAGDAVNDGTLSPEQAGEAWVTWARESAPAGSDFMLGYGSTGAEPWWEVCEDPERIYIPTAVPTAGEKPGKCPPGAVSQQ